MANLMALATQLGCAIPERPPEDPNLPTQVYINDAQTQTVYCPDGSAFSYTVEAGTLTSPPYNAVLGPIWVEIANAWAAAYALEQASAMMDCATRPEQPPGDSPGGPDIPPPPGGGGTPLMDSRFYWCCLGETLVDSLNTYTFGGRANAEYTITVTDGSIPPGTTFSQIGPRTCLLSGTPTAAGAYAWKIHAVSTTAPTLTIDVWDNLFVFGLTNGALPDADAGVPYPDFQFTAAGGNGPGYTFTSADLPTGFTLTDSGVLSSNDTTVAGDYTFTVTVTDELGASCDQEVDITVLVACPTTFADFVWTISTVLWNSNPVWTASASGASGAFSIALSSPPPPPWLPSPEQLFELHYDAQFCNDNPWNIPITFTIPIDATGGVFNGSYFHNVAVQLWINGVFQDSDSRDLITFFPPAQTIVLNGTLPSSTDSTITLIVLVLAAPSPTITVFSNPSWSVS